MRDDDATEDINGAETNRDRQRETDRQAGRAGLRGCMHAMSMCIKVITLFSG